MGPADLHAADSVPSFAAARASGPCSPAAIARPRRPGPRPSPASFIKETP
jgi:hypothetical protein